MKFNRDRYKLFIALVAAGLSIILLSMSLRSLQIRENLPFEELWAFLFGEFGSGAMFGSSGAVDVPFGDWIIKFVRIGYFIALVSFPVSVILAMVDKESRNRVIRATILLILIAVALLFYMRQPREPLEDIVDPVGTLIPQADKFTFEESDIEFDDEESPEWMVWAVTVIIATVLTSIVLAVTLYIRHKRQAETLSYAALSHPLTNAVSALQRGEDFDETILQCYVGMMRAVEAYRGLRKGNTITASEFVDSLIKAGLPVDAVKELTRLFEGVRYGQHRATPEDELRAIENLRRIANRLEEATHESA